MKQNNEFNEKYTFIEETGDVVEKDSKSNNIQYENIIKKSLKILIIITVIIILICIPSIFYEYFNIDISSYDNKNGWESSLT